jgi:outer membrane protein assembly factor BamB
MKWQNLTDRIRGSAIAFLLISGLISANAAGAQNKSAEPFLLKKCWVSEVKTPAQRLSASDNDKVLIFSESSGKMGALDLISGHPIWQSEFGGEIVSNIVTDQTSVFFAANPAPKEGVKPDSTTLRSVSKQTGITIWSVTVPYSEKSYLGWDVNYMFAVTADGVVVALDKKDGTIKWQTSLDKTLAAAPHFTEKYIGLAVESGEIFLISSQNGERLSQMASPFPAISVFISDINTLISGDKKGNLWAIDIPTKQVRWKFKNGAQVSSITGAGENMLVSSYDNFVYQMSPANGNVLWKRRLPGRVIERPLVTRDFAVVRVLGEPEVSFIDLKTGKILGKIVSEGEDDITTALVTGPGLVVLGKSDGIYLYGVNNCDLK